ncbi:helix-turn-helix domain-containing protein [Xanthocytophaga flava]|uniref:helix-turn-helix domain-containing protein n=1 Tax=Xanthocytophaga flava TaxID=3048013 RepID=UPI0028D46F53|nr:helix-turn-helix domain-containing protein [Xanthocytophaga flavus]MDJ1466472.1 helix-turn-helix domain-containing protein [Xanthocytophaga flavus]
MRYTEYTPCEALKPFIKTYYLFETDGEGLYEDTAFATGCMEVMFNMSTNKWQSRSDNQFVDHSPIELWGQVIQPLSFRTTGKSSMLGARFHAHTSSFLLEEGISLFNDHISNLADVIGNPVNHLHERLLNTPTLRERLLLLDQFFLNRLAKREKVSDKLQLLSAASSQIQQREGMLDVADLATRYGISSRYLHKLFVQHVGVSPKLYQKIHRFQQSLMLLHKGADSLTTIAYQAGYSDQSHFIRDFKSFTHKLPSEFSTLSATAVLVSPCK